MWAPAFFGFPSYFPIGRDKLPAYDWLKGIGMLTDTMSLQTTLHRRQFSHLEVV
jgi:hypothetical protein